MQRKKPLIAAVTFALISGSITVDASTLTKDNASYKDVQSWQDEKHFEVSLAILALKPSATNLNYAIYNKALPLQSPSWYEQELRPAYTSAFNLGARWLFQRENDLNLDWTHLYSTTSSSVTAPAGHFVGPDWEINPQAIPIRSASGWVAFKYDVVNLDVAQSLRVNNHVSLRLFGGLSNGFLREQTDAVYSGNMVTGSYQGPFRTDQEVTSSFIGIGPRLGIEAQYNAASGFGVIGSAAASALVGSSYAKTTYVTSSQELLAVYNQTYNYQRIADQNYVQVVPGFDTRLGVSYTHKLSNGIGLILELGYEASVYVNAINQYLPGSLVADHSIDTGGIFVATMNHTQSNYSVQGPFLRGVLEF